MEGTSLRRKDPDQVNLDDGVPGAGRDPGRGFCHVNGGTREARLHRLSCGGNLAPAGERLRPKLAKAAAGDQVALNVEVVVNGGMGGKEPLRRAR